MRIGIDEFEKQSKAVLNKKPKLSTQAELALFAQAEGLLTTRRERHASQEAVARQTSQARMRRGIYFSRSVQQLASRGLEFFAIHPDTPAAATTMIALVLAFVAFHSRSASTVR